MKSREFKYFIIVFVFLLNFASCKDKSSQGPQENTSNTDSQNKPNSNSNGNGDGSKPQENPGKKPDEEQEDNVNDEEKYTRALKQILELQESLEKSGFKFTESGIDEDYLYKHKVSHPEFMVESYKEKLQALYTNSDQFIKKYESIANKDQKVKLKIIVDSLESIDVFIEKAKEATYNFTDYCEGRSNNSEFNLIAQNIKDNIFGHNSPSQTCESTFNEVISSGVLVINEQTLGFPIKSLNPLRGLENIRDLNIFGIENNKNDEKLDLGRLNEMVKLSSIYITNKALDFKFSTPKEGLISLTVENCNIQNIESIKYFPNLKELIITNHSIREIRFLEKLKYLTILTLTGSLIEDLAPVESLIHLKKLNLRGNRISQLPDLSSLKMLTYLNIRENYISDLTPISRAYGLEHLVVNKNEIVDLTPISSLTKLKALDHFDNPIRICPKDTPNATLNDVCKLYYDQP